MAAEMKLSSFPVGVVLPSSPLLKLAYLFTAYFEDGSTIKQTFEDVSILDSKRSAFYDVKQRDKEPVLFVLTKVSDGSRYSVYLKTGQFHVQNLGIPDAKFFVEIPPRPTSEVPLRIVFFRRHWHQFNVGKGGARAISHELAYCIGWQCTYEEKNYQAKIMLF